MRILHVVHDFLPNHVAGVEVYTDEVARRQAQTHEVALFYSEVAQGCPDYSLRRGMHGCVRTYELVNNHRYRDFRESYENPAVEARFREVLDEFSPDVVHIQHLLNLSLGIVDELRARGVATVMTLHDHWLACANGGQRFQRAGGRCERLEANRCGACIGHMNGLGWRARALFGRLAEAGPQTVTDLRLLDLDPTVREAPEPQFIRKGRMDVDGVSVPIWITHPPARLCFELPLTRPGLLRGAFSLHPDTFGKPGGGVLFSLRVDGRLAVEKSLDPKRNPEDRWPVAVRIELPAGPRSIDLRTEALFAENPEHTTAGWIDMRVQCDGPPPEAVRRRTAGALVGIGKRVARWPVFAQTRAVRTRWKAVRAMASRVDLFIAPSRFLADEMVKFGLPERRVSCSDYGFPVERFHSRRDLPDVARRFAFVGSLVPHKGAHVLLEAFNGMPADARLELCGSLDYAPDYVSKLRAISRHPGVKFVGGIAPERVARFLRRVDCLIVPSIWTENSPLTIHEAFLSGVPVVASQLGGHVDLLCGGGGLLYDADDPSDLREKLIRLNAEPGMLRQLAAGIPAVKSMEEHLPELEQIYEGLVAGQGIGGNEA